MRTLFIIIITIAFCAGSIQSYAQLSIQNYGIAQGLAQTQVSCLAEDSLGYLWVGTLGGGVSRFDGAEFENFTVADGLPSNGTLDLLITKGKIWIATQKGISVYDGNHFRNFKLSETDAYAPSRIFSNGDSIFYRLNNGQTGMILNDSIHSSFKHPVFNQIIRIVKVNGTTLVLRGDANNPELIVIDKNGWRRIYINGIFTYLNTAFIHQENIMISTNGGLFSLHENTLTKILSVNFPIYGSDDPHNSFLGVKEFSLLNYRGDGSLKKITDVNFIIFYSLVDREGNIWWRTERGLFKLHFDAFEKVFNDADKDDPVLGISQYNGELWIGTTYQGIKIYKDFKLVRKYNFGNANRNLVHFFTPDRNGKFFIGTHGGLAAYENEKINWIGQETIESVLSVAFDKDNNAYFGSGRKGLYYISNDKISTVKEFDSTPVWGLRYNEENDFFVVATNIGLWKLKNSTVEKIQKRELEGIELICIEWLDPNTLIIGTLGKGVFIYSFLDNSIFQLSTARGLSSDIIFFTLPDKNGFWVGTERGIDFVQITDDMRDISKITHYDDKDGLAGLETNKDAFINIDGFLYFGLVDGLYRFKGKMRKDISNPLHIDKVTVFINDTSSTSHPITNGKARNYWFSNKENHLSFSFNKVNKHDPSDYYYRYKLKGLDEIWSTPTPVKSVTYGNLSPGDYTLLVVASDKSGSFEYDQTQLNFNIHPAFYQTLLFKVAAALMVILLFAFLTILYNRNKVHRALLLQEIKNSEQARLRKDIARDFHDELGNQVARMINYVGLLRIKQKLETDVYETLHSYANLVLGGTKDFVWALDPTNDELGNLIIHLKDFGERMFQEKNIDFRFDGELPPSTRLPMGHSRQINLIFKEAMTNAFRHSRATMVNFQFKITDQRITLSLADNGIGIPTTEWDNSERGIENMKTRAQRINAILSVNALELGTKITVTLQGLV